MLGKLLAGAESALGKAHAPQRANRSRLTPRPSITPPTKPLSVANSGPLCAAIARLIIGARKEKSLRQTRSRRGRPVFGAGPNASFVCHAVQLTYDLALKNYYFYGVTLRGSVTHTERDFFWWPGPHPYVSAGKRDVKHYLIGTELCQPKVDSSCSRILLPEASAVHRKRLARRVGPDLDTLKRLSLRV